MLRFAFHFFIGEVNNLYIYDHHHCTDNGYFKTIQSILHIHLRISAEDLISLNTANKYTHNMNSDNSRGEMLTPLSDC